MKCTWIGQNGLYFETGKLKIMVDPYLSDSIYELKGDYFRRMVPVEERFLGAPLDVLFLTHEHDDHTNLQTLYGILGKTHGIKVLAPRGAFNMLAPAYSYQHTVNLFDRGCEWTEKDVHFVSVRALHSDDKAVGGIFHADGKTVYITGDTLYSREIVRDVSDILGTYGWGRIDYMFVCINGWGNNMNCADAARLTKAVNPRNVLPVHFGMFERFSEDPEKFVKAMSDSGINVIVPTVYGETEL